MENPSAQLSELFALKEQLCSVAPRLFTDQIVYDSERILNWIATQVVDYRSLSLRQRSEAEQVYLIVEGALKIVSRVIVLRWSCSQSLNYFELLITMRRHIIELCTILSTPERNSSVISLHYKTERGEE